MVPVLEASCAAILSSILIHAWQSRDFLMALSYLIISSFFTPLHSHLLHYTPLASYIIHVSLTNPSPQAWGEDSTDKEGGALEGPTRMEGLRTNSLQGMGKLPNYDPFSSKFRALLFPECVKPMTESSLYFLTTTLISGSQDQSGFHPGTGRPCKQK